MNQTDNHAHHLSLSREAFCALARDYNLIPVYREILGDLHTPVSAFHKLDDGRFAYLLESVEGGESVGRYSFLGGAPSIVFSARGRQVTIERGGQVETRMLAEGEDPLHLIKSLLNAYQVASTPGLPKFFGGAVGYFGYDTVRFFEELPDAPPDDLQLPDCQFVFTDACVIFDHVRHRIFIVVNAHVDGDAYEVYDRTEEKNNGLDCPTASPRNSSPRVKSGC